jgi:hypothetical protein
MPVNADKIGEILAWVKAKDRERDVRLLIYVGISAKRARDNTGD